MLRFTLLLAAVMLPACAMQPPQPAMVTPEKQARLQQLLEGKLAGAPVSCITHRQADDMTVISDNTVLFRDGSRVFRNDFNGARCTGLGSGFYAMQTRTSGSGLCRGDIVNIVDTRTGMMVGTCTLGDFVPYTRTA